MWPYFVVVKSFSVGKNPLVTFVALCQYSFPVFDMLSWCDQPLPDLLYLLCYYMWQQAVTYLAWTAGGDYRRCLMLPWKLTYIKQYKCQTSGTLLVGIQLNVTALTTISVDKITWTWKRTLINNNNNLKNSEQHMLKNRVIQGKHTIKFKDFQGLSKPNSLKFKDQTLHSLRHKSKLNTVTTLRIQRAESRLFTSLNNLNFYSYTNNIWI